MKRRDFIKYGTILAGAGGVCYLCGRKIFYNGKISGVQKSPVDVRPCKNPFLYCEIQADGHIYPCCPAFLKYKTSAGSVENEDFIRIWNGELLSDLRKRMLKGDYSMCNRDICLYSPCSEDEIPSDYTKGPKFLKISYDQECGYNCITCRDNVIINTPEQMKLYDEVYLPKVIEAAKNAEEINLLGSGDPLFSRHSRHLIRELIKVYPNIKFTLCTNGLLLDDKNLTELGIKNNISGISLSIDSVNRETYKKILRTDAFDTVMKNLELMAEWKKQGKIAWIAINFVVHLMNYKEMPDFVRLAQKLDVLAFFTTYRPWESAEYYKRYDEIAVFEPKNKHYKEFVQILQNPVFKDKTHCYLEPKLFDIANS